MWIEFPLDKGAVNSRTPSQLAPGEFQQASNVRYKPGSKQLHNDLNWKPWETTLNLVEPFATKWFGPFYLNFEGKNDWLMLVANVSGFLETGPRARIYFAREEESGTWERSSYVLADNVGNQVGITAASINHWGDRYYLATDQGCVEIAPSTGTGIPTVRRLGFLEPDGSVMRRINVDTTPATAGATATMAGASGSDFVENDIVSIFVTEYDANTGIESAPVWGGGPNFTTASLRFLSSRVTSSLEGKGIAVTFPDSFYNSDATTFRAYIKYWGLATVIDGATSFTNQFVDEARVQWYEEAVVGASLLTNGGTSEFDAGETITFANIEKAAITNPLPVLGIDNARLIFPAFRYPSTANVAAVWNDSLVLNDSGFHNSDDLARETSAIPTILRYGPPGEPFNQPVPYFLNFASEREDAIKGLVVVNDRLLVLCDQACHTVRYLPFNNLLASQQGRVKDVLTTNVGLVSPKASAKIETMRGEMAVWLSHRGLEWTDGTMWDDACRDFKIPEGVDASEALLVNMSSEYRLDLYLGTNLYSFYYHPDHLKDGRLKMLGPTDIGYIVTGACEYKGNAYRFDGFQLYQKDSENKGGYGYVLTGQVRGANPFKDLVAEDLALTHSASDADFSCRADGAVTGNEASIGNTVLLQNPQLEETGSSGTSQRGNYLRFWFGANGFDDDWAIGPAWLNLDQESGGLG